MNRVYINKLIQIDYNNLPSTYYNHQNNDFFTVSRIIWLLRYSTHELPKISTILCPVVPLKHLDNFHVLLEIKSLSHAD